MADSLFDTLFRRTQSAPQISPADQDRLAQEEQATWSPPQVFVAGIDGPIASPFPKNGKADWSKLKNQIEERGTSSGISVDKPLPTLWPLSPEVKSQIKEKGFPILTATMLANLLRQRSNNEGQ